MFFNIDNMLDCQFDIYIGNQLVHSQKTSMLKQMIATQFMQMCKQVANDSQPIHVVVRRWEDEWNQLDGKMEQREYKLEYWNKQEVW